MHLHLRLHLHLGLRKVTRAMHLQPRIIRRPKEQQSTRLNCGDASWTANRCCSARDISLPCWLPSHRIFSRTTNGTASNGGDSAGMKNCWLGGRIHQAEARNSVDVGERSALAHPVRESSP